MNLNENDDVAIELFKEVLNYFGKNYKGKRLTEKMKEHIKKELFEMIKYLPYPAQEYDISVSFGDNGKVMLKAKKI